MFMPKFKLIFLSIFLLFVLLHNYLSDSMPYTHDGENHLARFANYKVALKEGQLPPRLAPNLVNHYGYPVFNYNYPLANLLSTPFSALKISYELTFKLLVITFLFFGGLGVWQWLKQIFTKNIKNDEMVVGLFTYYLSFYLVNLVLFRGNIGEIMIYGLLPWILFSINRLQKKLTPLALSFHCLIWTLASLAHNLGFLMAIIISLMMVIFYFLKLRDSKYILRILLIWIIAALLSSWFWLPAIIELPLVAAGNSNINQESYLHLLSFTQLISNKLEFGFSLPGEIDTISLGLGPWQWSIIILSTVFAIKNLKKDIWQKFYLFFIFVLIILQTSLAKILWQNLSILQIWQFPWRWQLVISILLVPLSVGLWKRINILVQYFFVALLCLQLFIVFKARPVDFFHHTNDDYDAFSQSTTTQNENMPLTFRYKDIADWKPSPSILSGDAQIAVSFWSGSSRSYNLVVKDPVTIIEPTAYFPGWQTIIYKNNGEKSIAKYFDNDQIQGRIAYNLTTGDYRVETKFYQLTNVRHFGNALFVIGLLILGFFNIKYRKIYV